VLRALLGGVVAWWVVGLPPRAHLRRPDPAVMRAVLSYGLPATGGDLALYARSNADYAIAGRRLGADPLGVYALAWSAAAGPAALIGAFFGGVGFATFSRLQHDRDRLRAVYLAATRLIAVLALPLFVSAIFVRDDVVSVLYGERWTGMIAPLLPLFLLQGVRQVCRPGASLTLALGHNRLYAACGIISLPLSVAAVLIGTPYGITGVSWGMLIAIGGSSLLWPAISWMALRPSLAQTARVFLLPVLLAAITASSVALTQRTLAETPVFEWLRLLLAALTGLGVFLLAARLCWRSLRTDIDLLRESLPQESAPLEPVVEAALVVPAMRAAPVVEA
jgi:PST family polysaccharide transporter